MSFASAAARLRDSVFANGEDAQYKSGGTGDGDFAPNCKVLRALPDEVTNFGEQRVVVATAMFRLRKAEVECPAEGDTITLASAEIFKIIGTPRMNKWRTEYLCEATLIA